LRGKPGDNVGGGLSLDTSLANPGFPIGKGFDGLGHPAIIASGEGAKMLLISRALRILASALGLGFALSCDHPSEPVRVGFVATLTGRYSDLGVSGRDGVILAVEEKNRSGGLLGRPIELLIKDDKNDGEIALEVDRELVGSGVIGIIGHMLSTMSLAALPLLEAHQTVMISPTTASPLLSEKKDLFFRVYEPVDKEVLDLAKWISQEKGIKRMAVIYDLNNPTYAQDYAERFERAFKDWHGSVPVTMATQAARAEEIVRAAQMLNNFDIDALLIVHNALDTALILEILRRNGWQGTAFASPWSMTKEILEQGGQAVEGLHSIVPFLPDHPSERYQNFRKAFLQRFRREPDFPAVCGYEAAQVLFKAFEKARASGKALADAILEIGEFEGLQSKIVMDEFGDPKREKFRVTVREGKMERAS
jgi:branched-chain amino acid transport system substrate-binding protein